MADNAQGIPTEEEDNFHFSEYQNVPQDAAGYAAWANDNPDHAFRLLQRTLNSFRVTAQEYQQAQTQQAGTATYVERLERLLNNLDTGDRNGGARLSKKVNDPDEFTGDKSKYEAFITQLTIKLKANADHFPEEHQRVAYVFSLLRDKALDQVRHYIDADSQDITCPDAATLIKDLGAAFGDPDRRSTAQNVIASLQQKNKSFLDYYSAFSREIGYTGYDSEAKKSMLYRGLSTELLHALEDKDVKNMTYEELVAKCQSLDSNMKHTSALIAARGGPRQPRAPGAPFTPPAPPARVATAPPATGEPMDLSAGAATTRAPGLVGGKLTAEEKARRRQLGLCSYCGGPGHIAVNCPTLAARNQRVTTHAAAQIEAAPTNPGNA